MFRERGAQFGRFAVSPDDRLIAIATSKQKAECVEIRALNNGAVIERIPFSAWETARGVRSLCWSADGRFLCGVGGYYGAAPVWICSLKGGRVPKTIYPASARVTGWSSADRSFVVSSSDGASQSISLFSPFANGPRTLFSRKGLSEAAWIP